MEVASEPSSFDVQSIRRATPARAAVERTPPSVPARVGAPSSPMQMNPERSSLMRILRLSSAAR